MAALLESPATPRAAVDRHGAGRAPHGEATVVGMLKSGKAPSGKSHPVAKASDDELKSLYKWITSL